MQSVTVLVSHLAAFVSYKDNSLTVGVCVRISAGFSVRKIINARVGVDRDF